MDTRKTIVGTIFGTRGEDDPDYVGIVQAAGGPDAIEEATIDLTAEQYDTAAAAQAAYRRDLELDFEIIEQAYTRIRATAHIYQTSMAWLEDLRKTAYQAQEDAEYAAWEVKAQADTAAMAAELARQDAELGPRDFIRMERTNLTQQEKYDRWAENPKIYRLHKAGCRLLPDRTRIGAADDLRIGEAIDLYVRGAESCGVCTPDEQLAADEASGQRVHDIRTVRESVIIPMTQGVLRAAVEKARFSWWQRGAYQGIVSVALGQGSEQPKPGELVLGWRTATGTHAEPIPAAYRDLLSAGLSARKWWTVRWIGGDDGQGYLAVGLLTMAQRREVRQAKPAGK